MNNLFYKKFLASGAILLMFSTNSMAYEIPNRTFVLNNCHCQSYTTVVEQERYEKHNMRLELWIPQGGMHIREVYTQEYNLRGNTNPYSKNLIIQNHTDNKFEKELDKTNWPNCKISYNIDGSFNEVDCNLLDR